MKKVWLLLCLSLGLTGCQSGLINKLVKTPEIKAVQLQSFSMQDKRITFDVSLFNPNPFTLPIDGLGGIVALNGLDIGSISAKTNTKLAANTTQVVSMPISLDTEALGRAARSVLTKQTAEYQLQGKVDTSMGKVPFSKKGNLSVSDIISALMHF